MSIPLIVVTGCATRDSVARLSRLEVSRVIEKPVELEELVVQVGRAVQSRTAISQEHNHATERCVRAFLAVLGSPSDLRTIPAWGHYVGASAGSLRTWCDLIGVSPKRTLSLARVLRAVTRLHELGIPLKASLDIVDRRTLSALLVSAGVPVADGNLTVQAVLDRQSLVDNRTLVVALRRSLGEGG